MRQEIAWSYHRRSRPERDGRHSLVSQFSRLSSWFNLLLKVRFFKDVASGVKLGVGFEMILEGMGAIQVGCDCHSRTASQVASRRSKLFMRSKKVRRELHLLVLAPRRWARGQSRNR